MNTRAAFALALIVAIAFLGVARTQGGVSTLRVLGQSVGLRGDVQLGQGDNVQLAQDAGANAVSIAVPSVPWEDVAGAACGTATIADSATSTVVVHGLTSVPSQVLATGRDLEVAGVIASARDATSVTLAVASPTTAGRSVDWCVFE